MKNANKYSKMSYFAMLREVEKWSGIRIRGGVYHQKLNDSSQSRHQVSRKSADYFCSNPADRQHTHHTQNRTN